MSNHENNEEKSKRDFVTSPSLQHAIKKTRWKQVILYIFISIVTLIVFGAFILFGSQHLINKKIEKDDEHKSILQMKSMSISSSGRFNYNLFSATSNITYYKKIGNREIVWDTEIKKYPVFGRVEMIDRGSGLVDVIAPDKDTRFVRYNHFNNERIIDFYYPELEYKLLPQELEIATKLDENKLIEVALSFDKPRKAKDVKKLLGAKNVDWLWVNITSDKRMKELKSMQGDFQKVKHGEKAEGITNKLKFSQFKENPADKLVSGAVLVGTPAELKKFEQFDFIRASVIGVTIDKY